MDFLRVKRKQISAFIEGLTTQLHIEIGNVVKGNVIPEFSKWKHRAVSAAMF